MNNLLQDTIPDSVSRSLASRKGICPEARSEKIGPGRFDNIQAVLSEQRFAMIAVYSLAILVALGYVPGIGLGL